jgi:hypothetical protein
MAIAMIISTPIVVKGNTSATIKKPLKIRAFRFFNLTRRQMDRESKDFWGKKAVQQKANQNRSRFLILEKISLKYMNCLYLCVVFDG